MKKRLFLLCCAASLIWLPAKAEEEKDQTELGKHMEAMNDAFKAFRRETDAVKGAIQAREAEDAVLKGMTEIPALIKEMPEGPEKAKALAAAARRHVESEFDMAGLIQRTHRLYRRFLSARV